MEGLEVVVDEGLGGDGDDGLDEGEHGVGVVADFLLGVIIHAQREEMKNVVQVALPVPLGVNTGRQGNAGDLAGDAALDEILVALVALLDLVEVVAEFLGGQRIHRLSSALAIGQTLFTDGILVWMKESIFHH